MPIAEGVEHISQYIYEHELRNIIQYSCLKWYE